MGKVLVVDDEQDAIDFVRTMLEEDSHQVVTAFDGKAGLEAASAETPDLIVLDVQMPEMDGFHVFQELQKNDATKAIPVVMLTGVAERTGIGFDKESMKEYLGVEPAAYIEKPVDPGVFKSTIADIIA